MRSSAELPHRFIYSVIYMLSCQYHGGHASTCLLIAPFNPTNYNLSCCRWLPTPPCLARCTWLATLRT